MTKKCPVCHQAFITKNATKFCSTRCRIKHQRGTLTPKRKSKESICWTCSNACLGCSWSQSFTPVKGWTAKKTKISGNSFTGELIDSYHVIECPEYRRDIR